jgi:hypothetical protein
MNIPLEQLVEQAIAALPGKKIAKKGRNEFEVRKLFPVSSWKPHDSGRIVGEDSCGNDFIYSSDGSVFFSDHETGDKTMLASSIETFLTSLSAPEPVVLKPGQVKQVWVNPKFLEEQKRKGNASND